MRLVITAAAITAFALGGAGAEASSLGRPCTAAPETEYLSIGQLQAKAEEQGYEVSKAKIAKACGEIYARDTKGNKIELFMDPTNGAIVGTKEGPAP